MKSDAIITLLVSFFGGSGLSAILSYLSKRRENNINSSHQLMEQFNKTLQELFNRVDKLNKTVDELNNKLSEANSSLITERQRREEKEFENRQLKDKIDILNKQIDELTNRVKELNHQMGSINTGGN